MLTRLAAAATLLAALSSAQVNIELRSGQAVPGQPDPNIKFLGGPATAPFPGPFVPADFQSARTGSNATVLTSLAGWPSSLPDRAARYIDTANPNSTSALYAIDFTISTAFRGARLTMDFVADDRLGTTTEAGVYLNGQPVPGTFGIGNYYSVTRLETLDVGPLLQQGTNTLYVYLVNTGGRGGLMFSASIGLSTAASIIYGQGCPGSRGTPRFVLGAGQPQIGSAMPIDLYNLVATPGPAILGYGLSRTAWLGSSLPLDLAPFGINGCSAHAALDYSLPLVNVGGAAQVAFPIPPNPRLVGLEVFLQALVPDPAAPNPLQIAMSDAVGLLIGL